MKLSNRDFAVRAICALAAAWGLGCASPASAADKAQVPEIATKKQTDGEFMSVAAHIDFAEMQLGRLANRKSVNPDVIRFAMQMQTDHARNRIALRRVAAHLRMRLPRVLDPKHQALQNKLQNLKDVKFDEEYIHAMVEMHKDAVNLFEKASKSGQGHEVREYATRTLPALQEHLRKAQAIESRIASASVRKPEESGVNTSASGLERDKPVEPKTTPSEAR